MSLPSRSSSSSSSSSLSQWWWTFFLFALHHGGGEEVGVMAVPKYFLWRTAEERRKAAMVAAAAAAREGRIGILERNFDDPSSLFDTCLVTLVVTVIFSKLLVWQFNHTKHDKNSTTTTTTSSSKIEENKPEWARNIQMRFLPVFWLNRTAFWMSGPYFYAVYASKIINGAPATASMLSHIFLAGFASVAILGPMTGRAFDRYGRKKGTIAATIVYSLGAISTQSNSLSVLFLGRGIGGVGTSMLANAPESWLVSEFQRNGDEGKWLYDTFSLAFSGDSIVAILAGQLAGYAASYRGPKGPFEVSPLFLAVAALLAGLFWKESKATSTTTTTTTTNTNTKASANTNNDTSTENKPTRGGRPRPTKENMGTNNKNNTGSPIREAITIVWQDPKILAIGAIQSIFEACMYVFVMQWPPTLNAAIVHNYGEFADTPYGTVFSCFMACCLLGSTIFGQLGKLGVPRLTSATIMLTISALSLAYATYAVASSTSSLTSLIVAFFVYEACVGMYFPCIGLLRSQYLPDSHRAVIMTLFGVPLNILVVGVFLLIHSLGATGALGIAAGALTITVFFMLKLRRIVAHEKRTRALRSWRILKKTIEIDHHMLKGKGKKHERVSSVSSIDMGNNRGIYV